MKVITDRVEWIAAYMRRSPEERAADEQDFVEGRAPTTYKKIAFQSLDELRAIAETLDELLEKTGCRYGLD